MSGYTPGPWTMTRMGSGNTRISFELEAENGYVVAYIDDSNSDNAQLIAAAPDLLAMLEDVYADLADSGTEEDDPYLARISDVIDRATGIDSKAF